MEVTKMAGLLEYRPAYFARQDEANAKMNRILREEQRIKPFMKGPALGTNPIPSLIGGRNSGSGIIGIQRDPNELGLGGGIPDTTPLFTNMYGGEQEGLLASMGIRPEVLAQAKIQQQTANQPFSGTREQAYQMAMKKANEMGIPLELAAKQFKAAFPEAKKYEPKTQAEALEFKLKDKQQELGIIGKEAEEKEKGKQAAKFTASLPKAKATLKALNNQWTLVDNTLDEAIALASPYTAGLGAWLSFLPASKAKTLSTKLTTLGANIGFDKLQQMRADSPTGGALGQVSDFENKLLQAVKGSLEQSLSASELIKNLQRIKKDLNNVRTERNSAFLKDYGALISKSSDNVMLQQLITQPTNLPQGAVIYEGKQTKDGKPVYRLPNGQLWAE